MRQPEKACNPEHAATVCTSNAYIKMKKITNHLLVLAACAVMVGFFAPGSVQGQGFDPAQFRERQLENYRERLDVKSDDDWKKIEPLVSNVMDAQRDARMGAGFGGFGRGGRGGRGGGDGGDANNRNRNRVGGTPSPQAEALEKALDDKAPPDELKTKLAKFREARKEKEAALAKTQDELRKALSARQEAAAVLAGLLK